MKKTLLIIILAGTVFAQNPQIKSEDLLKFRNLQYEQAKRALRMQDLRNEFDRLNSEQQKIGTEIDNWIKEQAKVQNVDLAKYVFDSDQLKFVEIKKNE